ncbi:MAG: serine/threonine protein kinase [Gemmataceae bacterium]|nr:serine/threonine protein kinase [Gemmataceae bacterium]
MSPDSSKSTLDQWEGRPGERSPVVEGAAGEMVDRWRRGERPLTEEYLDRFPDLRECPEAALELLAEELALRDEYGRPTSPAELAERFPLWEAQVRALVQCHRALGPQAAPRFPSPGDAIGEFRLVAELGRGSHGRVYLATQPALGGRPVVLKLGPAAGHEHLSLARLQHTHIVPLYSVHEFPEEGMRGLCLPHFGGTTLAAVLAGLDPVGRPAGGEDILTALRRAEPGGPAPPPTRSLAREALARAAYADAICWIGACLADALQYAHDRGLLHLDLKPSNILLAADGVPMLLDFHLARPPLPAGEPAPPWLGGTPGYMAPEQLTAVAAVRTGTAIPTALDGRADVYALGVVLREALRAPARGGEAVPGPAGLTDILARCTAADPRDRYPTTADVAADLRRHLADLPLKGVANRSLTERWTKWRRRRPLALPLALALGAVLAAGVGFWARSGRQVDRAETAFRDGETHLQNGRYAEAVQAHRAGETLLDGVPFRQGLRARLRESRRAAERGQAADDLHTLCEQVRPLYAADVVTPEQVRPVEARCRDLWARRDQIVQTLTGQPNPDLEPRWRGDLLDLGILTADLGVRAVSLDQAPGAHRQALATLTEAEFLIGPSGVLHLERARHARASGDPEAADAATRRARTLPPRTAWEHLAVGRAALGAGDVSRAAAEMDRALRLDPGSFWANYYKGTCRLRTAEPADALVAFSVCVALAPQSAWCFHNRGLAYAELGRLDDAQADFDRAFTLDPGLGAALLARASVHHRSGRYPDALADLRGAVRSGVPHGMVEYQKAVTLLAMNDRPAAVRSLRTCLAADPGHRSARELLARLSATP